jgi:chromate reductase, NAD(P)H dehydrogenase (quinone)
MTRIIGLSGSLRKASLNTQLLHAAARLLPDGASLEIADIHGVPLYDADVEAAGVPPAVAALKAQVAAADALLIATPEYNHSTPGVLKNALDWMSRPPQVPPVFTRRPVAIFGASPGGFGTARSQPVLLPVLRALQARVFADSPPFYLSAADKAFDAEGQLADAKQREHLSAFLKAFVVFAART